MAQWRPPFLTRQLAGCWPVGGQSTAACRAALPAGSSGWAWSRRGGRCSAGPRGQARHAAAVYAYVYIYVHMHMHSRWAALVLLARAAARSALHTTCGCQHEQCGAALYLMLRIRLPRHAGLACLYFKQCYIPTQRVVVSCPPVLPNPQARRWPRAPWPTAALRPSSA